MYSRAKGQAITPDDPFELVAVKSCKPPDNGASGAWCEYTIAQGDNLITCVRQGSRTVVKNAATEIVAVLNDRRVTRRGRTHLVLQGNKNRG
ncbi:MAG: hypothetical protein QNJ73_09600 [Gammaproteobacteria bacterium]|nr:hypothetical protein [Gammaproteobacteria bacterium]